MAPRFFRQGLQCIGEDGGTQSDVFIEALEHAGACSRAAAVASVPTALADGLGLSHIDVGAVHVPVRPGVDRVERHLVPLDWT